MFFCLVQFNIILSRWFNIDWKCSSKPHAFLKFLWTPYGSIDCFLNWCLKQHNISRDYRWLYLRIPENVKPMPLAVVQGFLRLHFQFQRTRSEIDQHPRYTTLQLDRDEICWIAFNRWWANYRLFDAFSYSRRGISMLPETIISSASGGTIGPLYSNNPSDFLVINSKLKWLLSHISNAGYHAQPLPRKLLAVCWHLGPL